MTAEKKIAKWMLHEKQIILLYELVTSKKRYVTGMNLSYATNTSLKTIKKEVEFLNAFLENIQVSIVSSPGEGYRIQAEDDDQYQKFREHIIDSVHRGRYFSNTQHGRVHYIIRRILSSETHIYLDDIAEECYVSKSVINKDIPLAKKELSKYGIRLTNHTNRGLFVDGSEWAKRICIIQEHRIYLNYIGVAFREHDMQFEEMLTLPSDDYYKIDELVFHTFCEANIAIPRNCYKKILLMFVLSINRSKQKNKLQLVPEIVEMFQYTDCYHLVGKILDEVSLMGYQLEEIDQMAITIFIMCLSTYDVTDLKRGHILAQVEEETTKLIDYIHSYIPIWEVIDTKLTNDITFQLFNVICRQKCNVYLEDDLFQRISDYGLLSLDLCQLATNYLRDYHGFEEHFLQETLQFYYVFSDFLNRKYVNSETLRYKRILVVNKAGYYASVNLANKLKNYIKSNVFEIIPVTYLKLFGMKLSQSDLVLADFMDRRLRQLDVRIEALEYFWGEHNLGEFIHIVTQNKIIDMHELMTPQSVHIGESISTRKGVMKFIEQKIIPNVECKSQVIAELEEREHYFSAAKTNQVVVLRSMKDYIGESRFHVIIPKKTFLWNGKPCSMILFYNVKNNQFDAHYFLNRVIANFIHNADFLDQRIVEDITYEQILRKVKF